jgi:hypothetical protein
MASPVLRALTGGLLLATACDSEPNRAGGSDSGPPLPAATQQAAATPAPPRTPEIIVDAAYVAVGAERVPTAQQGLRDRVSTLVAGKPGIEGGAVEIVAMRNSKPSQVGAVVAALQRAHAADVAVKTAARDDTTQRLPLSLAANVSACAVVAWIARDASIEVWPAGGGKAKRIIKGLAGPDVTLGTDAVVSLGERCEAPELIVGADEVMSWGLVFDLATAALHAPGIRAGKALIVANALPGRKVILGDGAQSW